MKEAAQRGLQKSQTLLNKAKQLQNDVKGTMGGMCLSLQFVSNNIQIFFRLSCEIVLLLNEIFQNPKALLKLLP